jgi:hypothetical protein
MSMFNKYQEMLNDVWYGRTMLNIAVDLHMHNMGSNPDLSEEDYQKGLNNLKKRLAEWKPTDNWGNPDFDAAVKLVIEITIIECELMPFKRGDK